MLQRPKTEYLIKAMIFDGVGDYIDLTTGITMDRDSSSISMWIKLDAIDDKHFL